jgi:hypothetical protein
MPLGDVASKLCQTVWLGGMKEIERAIMLLKEHHQVATDGACHVM